MSNWFNEHPGYTIICHTILVATTTWVVSSFVIDENKINLYRAESENSKAQINNEKVISEQYKAKVSVLESEIAKLRQENERYLSWLVQDPKSLPALDLKIAELEKQLAVAKEKTVESNDKPSGYIHGQVVPYNFRQLWDKGGSFVDPKTKATIGVSNINSDHTASGLIYIPGMESKEISRLHPGSSWVFLQNGKDYKLTLEKINWLNNSLEASVVELDDKTFEPDAAE